jgi:hypothetical protein
MVLIKQLEKEIGRKLEERRNSPSFAWHLKFALNFKLLWAFQIEVNFIHLFA